MMRKGLVLVGVLLLSVAVLFGLLGLMGSARGGLLRQRWLLLSR